MLEKLPKFLAINAVESTARFEREAWWEGDES